MPFKPLKLEQINIVMYGIKRRELSSSIQ